MESLLFLDEGRRDTTVRKVFLRLGVGEERSVVKETVDYLLWVFLRCMSME